MRSLVILLLTTTAGIAQATYTATVLAGSAWVGDNGPATEALLFQAEGLAIDPAGNLYIAEAQGHRVRQVSPGGVIVTIAGTGQPGFSGDGGPATAAQLNAPYGLAIDGRGNLYIADLGNARVRRVATDGTIATVASSPLVSPRNVAVDLGGNLYISDFDGQRVYKIGDGSLTPLITAGLSYPTALTVNPSGILYIADSGDHLIRKFDRGALTTVAAAVTPTGLAFDASGAMYIADLSAGQIVKIPPAGAVSVLPVNARAIAFGPDGSLYAASGWLVERVLPGPARIIAGGGSTAFGDGARARDARLNHPAGLAVDPQGNVFIADRDNNRIRRVDPHGFITTIAGTSAAGNSGDGGLATLAQLNGPSSVRLDAAGYLYVADAGNHRTRRFKPGGIMLAFADSVSPAAPAVDALGNTYIADPAAGRVLRIDSSQAVSVVAVDGPLGTPVDVAIGPGGELYLADLDGNRVLVLTPAPIPPAPVLPLDSLDAVSAASLQPGPLAPGMLVAIRGTVAGVKQVFFDGFPAVIVSADDAQILVQVPAQIAGRNHVPIEVLREQGFSSAIVFADVTDAAPALFSTGSGQASAVNQDGTINSTSHPVSRGSWISLYGTGEGITGLPVSVRIGGYAAQVLYSGAVAGYPGLFQINVRVPGEYMAPGILSVTVTVGSAESPPGVTIVVN